MIYGNIYSNKDMYYYYLLEEEWIMRIIYLFIGLFNYKGKWNFVMCIKLDLELFYKEKYYF